MFNFCMKPEDWDNMALKPNMCTQGERGHVYLVSGNPCWNFFVLYKRRVVVEFIMGKGADSESDFVLLFVQSYSVKLNWVLALT